MTDGHWGACPTRDKSEVVANESDIDRIVEKFFTAKLEKSKLELGQGKGKSLLIIEDSNREGGKGQMTVSYINFRRSHESMLEGKYDEYYISQFAGSLTLKVKNNTLPNGVFDSVEKAEKCLRACIKRAL